MEQKNWNKTFLSLNAGLPDDVRRLKEAGYYREAIARIDAYLAEDWTQTQNGPFSNGLADTADGQPENPTPCGVEALRDAMLAQREIMRRLPAEYPWTQAQALARLKDWVCGFTDEEFFALDRAGRMDWRFVEGEKHYQERFAQTLLATHADLAARRREPQPDNAQARARRQRICTRMRQTGAASACITLRADVGMSDEAFAQALEAARAAGRSTVHVRAWLPLPAACPAQSGIELLDFTEPPAFVAPDTAAQRTAYWEADLAENRAFGASYRYTVTAEYRDPLAVPAAPVEADYTEADLAQQEPHIVFTPYLTALARQLTQGVDDPAQKAKRIYDYITLNVRYHYQPSYFVHESLAEQCARDRRGDCGIMALTFITLCRLVGIPSRWQSGLHVTPEEAGCHDWAMFFLEGRGWFYADCSFGASMARQGDEEMRRHYFGSLDTDRMVANRAFAADFEPPMLGFREDPCDNQTGEVEADGVGLYGAQTVSHKTVVDYLEY